MKIAFIGLGHMGAPMACNLLKNNFEVTAFDLNKVAVNFMQEQGAKAADSVAEAVKDADAVITMLQKGEQVKQCCQDIFANIKAGVIYLDCSTIDVETSRNLHKKAEEQKIAMLDAPVSGGVAAASAGTLTFMVGGTESDFAKAEVILKAMGKKIILAGKAGAGAAAKICNNMLLAISMIGVSEAFVLAEKLGLEPQKLYDISANASGQCWSLTSYCPYPGILPNVPSSHDYKAGFTAAMMLKDLNLSAQAAEFVEANTPLGKTAQVLYQKFVENFDPELDFSGIIRMLQL